MIRALIFDFFGVIRPNDKGVLATYRKLGGNVMADETFITDIKMAGNFGFVKDADQQIADRLGVSLQTWFDAIGAHQNDQELLDFIATLRKQGTYKIGLLSNADAYMLSTYFEPSMISTYFNAALLSGDVGVAKPAAMFYRLMADKLVVSPEECVMVDDRREFCDGARHVGMQAIEYRHFDQFRAEFDQLLAKQNNQTNEEN